MKKFLAIAFLTICILSSFVVLMVLLFKNQISFLQIKYKNSTNRTNLEYMNKSRMLFYFSSRNIDAKKNSLPAQINCGSPSKLSNPNSPDISKSRLKRIINGQEVTPPNNWPWTVSLRFFSNNTVLSHFCSGSLIYDNYVLTAAHCLYLVRKENIALTFGLNILNGTNVNFQVYRPEKIFIHEKFNQTKPLNDIALIKLSKRVNLANHVSTLCLPDKDSDSVISKPALITGWGKTEEKVTIQTKTLRQTTLKIINGDNICSKFYQKFDTSSLYCAYDVSANGRTGPCTGDSGGSLFVNEGGKYFSYGILSFVFTGVDTDGRPKCLTEAPSYYTKVPKYIDWMASKINE